MTPEDYANQITRESENAKAYIFPPKGRHSETTDNLILPQTLQTAAQCPTPQFHLTAQIDEDYLVVGGHIDENTIDKIKSSQYIDFGKLLPKDRILAMDENKLELVIKKKKRSPVSEAVVINNFARWEQAFRIFSNVYTKYHPSKAGELIQYNHVIYSISLAYTWENVYSYDKEFRMHIARHPECSWAVILQQAWSMRLGDRVFKSQENGNSSRSNPFSPGTPYQNNNHNWSKSSEYCKRFNKGKCNLRSGCMYEQRYFYCHKSVMES